MRAVLFLLFVFGVAAPAHASDGLAFAVERHAELVVMCPDETRIVEVELRNVGLVPWSPAQRDRLAYHWRDEADDIVEYEGLRSELPGLVLPGARVRVRARLRAPPRTGHHVLQWSMVREDVRWYDEPDDARVSVEIAGEGSPFVWSMVEVEPIASIAAGETIEVRVLVKNEGCASWDASTGDALGARWRNDDGSDPRDAGVRTGMPPTAPGEYAELSARVRAPAQAGTAVLVLEPVREHVRWFGPPREGEATVTVAIDPPALAWSLVAIDPVGRGWAGQAIDVRARVRNEGTQPWSRETGDAWSYRWLDDDGQPLALEGPRTPFVDQVAPGDEIEVQATVVLPDTPGRWRLAWQPVREHVRWLGSPQQSGAWIEDIDVGAVQLAWAIDRAEVPSRLWAGRTTTVHAVVRNTGGETWSPRLGDRLSYRVLDRDGNVVPSDGMRTELPHDVAPGESVALDVRVRPPAQVGTFAIELAMVREHVAWFSPPTGPARHPVRLVWAGAMASVLALVGVFGLALVASSVPRLRPALAAVWLPLATSVVVALVGEVFRDVSGIEPWGGTRLAALSSSAWAGVLVLLVSARARPSAAVLVVALALALALVDLGYLEFFGSIVPLSAVAALHHLGDAHATVVSLWRPRYATLFVPAVVLVAAIALRPRARAPARRLRLRLALVGAFALAGLPSAAAVHELATGPIGGRVFSERDNVGRLGLWNAHAFEAWRGLRRWIGAEQLDPAMRAELAAFFAERHAGPAGPALAPGANLLVVQVEALQAWVVDARVGDQAVMPFLASADDRAVRFTSIFDQTAQGRTSDAEYLVLQSGHPLPAGALAFLRADNHFDTMAHRLADAGYTTRSAHPYARGFWNRAVLHPRYGFASSEFREELGPGPQIGWGLADREFLARVTEAFATTPQPFFTFAITLGLHHPYDDFPARFAELAVGELEATPLGNYLQAMRHADGALAATIAALERAGLLENTVVLVYGDHTAGLALDDDLLALAGELAWDPSLATRMHRVPAFVWIPGAPIAGRDDRPGGTIDLGPTVLEILGVASSPSAVGRSLLRRGPRVVALPDGSAIDDVRLYLARGRGGASGDACVERSTGRGRPLADCDALAEAARRELEVSRAVLNHDLHAEVGRPAALPSK